MTQGPEYVIAGSIVSVQVSALQTPLHDISSILQAVSQQISGSGLSVVNTGIMGGGSLVDQLAQGSILTSPFQFSMDIQVANDFASYNDVLSFVNTAVYDATGYAPTASHVASVTPPGGEAQPTGIAGLSPTGPGGAAATTPPGGIADAIAKFFSDVKNLLYVALAVVVLIVVLIAFGPNVGKIASAAI